MIISQGQEWGQCGEPWVGMGGCWGLWGNRTENGGSVVPGLIWEVALGLISMKGFVWSWTEGVPGRQVYPEEGLSLCVLGLALVVLVVLRLHTVQG